MATTIDFETTFYGHEILCSIVEGDGIVSVLVLTKIDCHQLQFPGAIRDAVDAMQYLVGGPQFLPDKKLQQFMQALHCKYAALDPE